MINQSQWITSHRTNSSLRVVLISSQLPVDGLNGRNGTSVLSPVEVDCKFAPGNVLEIQSVKEMTARVSFAMHIIVQVCNCLFCLHSANCHLLIIIQLRIYLIVNVRAGYLFVGKFNVIICSLLDQGSSSFENKASKPQ
jgi:hypothetical protein